MRTSTDQSRPSPQESSRPDDAIHVHRVRQRPGTDEPLHTQELIAEAPEYDNADMADEQAVPGLENRAQWELEHSSLPEEFPEDEQYDPSELSDSASVLTLYFSQQETVITNGETERMAAECDKEEEKEKLSMDDYKFRFVRARIGKSERSRSAPARPLTELEEFKESQEFACLETVGIDAGELMQKQDGKLDLDSVEGHESCKKFLDHIEELATCFKVRCMSRKYRAKFSQAYKVLYKEDSLCYLTEILDSAQEAFPYIIVNSEKYIFSPNVLRAGEQLFAAFLRIKDYLRDVYNMMCEDGSQTGLRKVITELRGNLADFDRAWTQFEKIYVFELMLIEKDARRYVLKAIELEGELKSYEMLERLKGRVVIRAPAYEQLRKRFVEMCCQINSVANFAGKGRDDLTIDVLIAAEEISRKVSDYKSRAVRKLAGQIKSSFQNIRLLFRKYSENIEAVDPQLKNNADLVEALVAFEKSWEKGKDFLLNKNICSMLISFSQLIEGLTEKYKELQEKVESMDADVFILIPCLAILRSLDDNDRSIYTFYYPEFGLQSSDHEVFSNLKRMYMKLKNRGDGYAVYNALEQAILEREDTQRTEGADRKQEIDKLLHEIKRIAILLQRNKPAEWNALMETAMGIIQVRGIAGSLVTAQAKKAITYFALLCCYCPDTFA